MTDIDVLLGKKQANVEKQIPNYASSLDESMKQKLYSIANKIDPQVITIDLIKKAINEYKQEKQIYTEVTIPNCSELALSYKRIMKIANLHNLANVVKLKLDNNLIMKIENLDTLSNIKWLDLSFNHIEKIEGLHNLKKLTDLSLFRNKVCEVEGLDECRDLNVLSLGMNNIKNITQVIDYLKKFTKLQALTINNNPFCEKDESNQVVLDGDIKFSSSYHPILASLENLKYLDYRPIDQDYRKSVTENYKQNQKDRNEGKLKADEDVVDVFERTDKLKKANAEQIIGFYKDVEKKFKEEISNLDEIQKKISKVNKTLLGCEGHVKEVLGSYEEDIVKLQEKKDFTMRMYSKYIDQLHEKFADESKQKIKDFKNYFKTSTKNIQNVKFEEVSSANDQLKDKLYEIEIWLKQKVSEEIKSFKSEVSKINTEMGDRTQLMKDSLSYKKQFQDLTNYIDNLKNQEKQNNNINEEEKLSTSAEELLDEELEKLNDLYEEKCNILKDDIDKERKNVFDTFFEILNDKEYSRNRKRIEEINKICELWNMKIKEAFEKKNQPSK